MKNQLVADILYEVADILDIKDVEFKPRAYRRAAQAIESMSRPIEAVAAEGRLREIPGVGEAIAEKVEEIIETGKLDYQQKLKKSLPIKVDELLGIEGVGPKKVKLFYKKLGVKSLKDLERAAKKGRLRELPGMGEKSEQHILESIEFAKSTGERQLLGYILPVADEIKEKMGAFPEVEKAEVAGSIRRRRETIGDIDILVITKHPKKVVDNFITLSNVSKVVAKGPTRSTVRLKERIECDLRVIPPGRFGAALMYFTGSKAHNIALRRIAIKKGWKLSEYGMFDMKGGKEKQIASRTEKDIYKKLGMQYIPPEIRENAGEIQAAKRGRLPRLIGEDDIRGDLQMHTKWSDGDNTIEEMALAAKRLGHEYIAITDHVGSLKIAGGMGEIALRKQMAVVEKAGKKLNGIKILKGAEVDIMSDGRLGMNKSVLEDLDIVVGSLHSGFRQDKEKITQRIIAAMESRIVNIIGHPTGRLINRRRGYEFDFEEVFEASKRTGTFLEINAYPNRLDLNAENVRYAIESGCKLSMGTDSHAADELGFIGLGVATARRGWAEKKDVINTLPLKKLMKVLKK